MDVGGGAAGGGEEGIRYWLCACLLLLCVLWLLLGCGGVRWLSIDKCALRFDDVYNVYMNSTTTCISASPPHPASGLRAL